MKTENNNIKKRKFINESAGQIVDLFDIQNEMSLDVDKKHIQKVIDRQRKINTMIFKHWFELRDLN